MTFSSLALELAITDSTITTEETAIMKIDRAIAQLTKTRYHHEVRLQVALKNMSLLKKELKEML